jgi:serine phosphatase RsbU (regulator of sigma subunit)
MNWRSTVGLPLGLSPESIYAEADCRLDRGTRLTLLTDGIVEAGNAAGELFGFERTRNISTQSAEAIARTAQAYGQEDDITVLTLTLVPETVPHA